LKIEKKAQIEFDDSMGFSLAFKVGQIIEEKLKNSAASAVAEWHKIH